MPGHTLSGVLSSNGSTVEGTLSGSAMLDGVRFVAGVREDASVTINGAALEGNRFEGLLTAGSFTFAVVTTTGSTTSACPAGIFVLRR